MIDIRKLKELVRLMVDNELTELDLRDSEEQVTVRRSHGMVTPQVMVAPAMAHAPIMAAAPALSPTSNAAGAHSAAGAAAPGGSGTSGSAASDEAGLVRIESPMVGTFYAAAKPDSPAFVTPGAAVSPNTVVCIIEAMKIFNEIKAECSGTVHKVLVKNGDPVEFGQPLFLVKPG